MNFLRTLVILLLSIASTLHAEESAFRTFSDKQGREMKAKLSRVSGDDVYIERQDGLSTKVDITLFSKKDQEFIRGWARKKTIKDDAFEIRFTTEVSDKSRWNDNGSGIMRKTWKESYGIVLKNTSYLDLTKIRIEYLIFKFEDALAAEKRSEGVIRRLQGEARIARIEAGEEVTIVSDKFPMLETKLAPGWSWKNGGKETSEDEMRGIWIKVYVDEILATELSRPENLIRKENWATSSTF